MNNNEIRNRLEKIIVETEAYDKDKIPTALYRDLNKWKWGSYGWVSPASLMVTAAWEKYYNPGLDCCKIWAEDENGRPIPGGYSIRSDDEAITIPLFAKYDLCEGFCSPNSGMQGSRAIEKMRTLKRLNRDFDNAQRTVFDLKLFASIMNQTNELQSESLLELIKMFICIAKTIRNKRIAANEELERGSGASFDLISALAEIPDPELTKCVVAACVHIIFDKHELSITGVEDYKTAADARAKKPGDLTVEKDGIAIMAIEVKDKTQKLDWQNIERAKRIIKAHPELKGFLFVMESRDAATSPIINEMVRSTQLKTQDGKPISFISLYNLYQLALPIAGDAEIIKLTSKFITAAPAIKPETRTMWIQMLRR